jgi:hypothetical protein
MLAVTFGGVRVALVIGGLAIVALGVLALVAPDVMWSWTERRNEAMGQVSERTPRWETGNRIGAVMAIVVGIVVFVVGATD